MWGCGPTPGDRLNRHGDEIVAAGQFFHTGTPVVLWIDPNGYDAYRCRRHFKPAEIMPRNPAAPDNPNRYNIRRSLDENLQDRIGTQGWNLENLQEIVDQFVIHYDVCGTSRRCFEILHDVRGLSVHFMLDVDGTIYQTLDLKERAWHAGSANDRSVGIEIAHIGAYPDMKTLNDWYNLDDAGRPYITFPSWMTKTGVRTPSFTALAARKEVIKGTINGRELMQYDFTNQQYNALIKLTATLAHIFPKLKLDIPRDAEGNLSMNILSHEELTAYSGLLAHWHITKVKIDPGPAFDWERVLGGARKELGISF
jgi:N-acetyl-anhydromuramyl-L-alanine amidase AmpD